jgi:hypothetical protein
MPDKDLSEKIFFVECALVSITNQIKVDELGEDKILAPAAELARHNLRVVLVDAINKLIDIKSGSDIKNMNQLVNLTK